MLIVNLIMFFLALIILCIAAYYGVKTLVWLAYALRVSQFVMAFILAAIATSLPELFVSVIASLNKANEIVIGNIIGSNIADITLIGGLIIVFARKINIKNPKIRRDSIWMFILGCLPIVLFFIGNSISRLDGIILLLSSIFYVVYIFKIKKEFKKVLEAKVDVKRTFYHTILLVICLILVYFSSSYVVNYAKLLAIDLKVSPLLISLFLIAIGTSLPELALETQAIRLKKVNIALGDLFGSVIVNSTIILGISALINPITAEITAIFIAALFFVLSAYLFVVFVYSGKKLVLEEGVGLIIVYILFVIIEFYVKTV